jgi:hypothetical protein
LRHWIEAIYISAHGLASCRTATAAAWAQQELAQWADLIGRALGWPQRQRDPDGRDGAATVPETRRFVTETAKLARAW